MNRSVDQIASAVPRTDSPVKVRTARAAWPVVVSLFLFPILRFAVGERSGSLALSLAALTLAYLLAVYLYYGAALLTYRRRTHVLWGGGLAAAAVGYVVSGAGYVWPIVLGVGMLVFTGVAVGRLARARVGELTTYVIGLIIVVLFGLALLLPHWPEMHRAASAAGREIADSLNGGIVAGLPVPEAARGQISWLQKMSAVVVRFLPVCIIMSLVAQYSVGFLWFACIRSRDEFRPSPLRLFIYWRVPVAALPILVAALLFRLTGGETARLVADNLLVALSVFYCVIGLALVEYYLRRLKVHWSLKAVVYLLLIPAGLTGYFVLVLFGLAISCYDWRSAPGTD